jgi:hypothetical protein
MVIALKPEGDAQGSAMVSPGMAKALTFAAFPLGAMLIVGAWWLHHDAKHS